MDIDFKKPKWSDYPKIKSFYSLRSDFSCDSSVIDTFLWSEYYNLEYAILNEEALVFKLNDGSSYYTWMPRCKEEKLAKYFNIIKEYFNNKLSTALKIQLSDKESIDILGLSDNSQFTIYEEKDLRDYIYLKDDLINLEGKKFQQKRNHINKFLRNYKDEWEYRTLKSKDIPIIKEFLLGWQMRSAGNDYGDEMIKHESTGLYNLLEYGDFNSFKCGGIFVFGKLAAFSIGSLNEHNNMAVINVEKAESRINGIYQMINKYFLLNEFPDVKYVNREDDMGLPGLRKSKESYNPHMYCSKYTVREKGISCH